MSEIKTVRFDQQSEDGKYCLNCSACCRWPGEVIFPPHTLAPIADWLGLKERDCAEIYFDLASDRQHLKAVETADGRCPFLVEDKCSIYPFRPQACRTFPYLWQRPEPELMRECRLYRALLWREKEKGQVKTEITQI